MNNYEEKFGGFVSGRCEYYGVALPKQTNTTLEAKYYNFIKQVEKFDLKYEIPINKFKSIKDINAYIINSIDYEKCSYRMIKRIVQKNNLLLDEDYIDKKIVFNGILRKYNTVKNILMSLKIDMDKFIDDITKMDISIKHIGIVYLDFYDMLLKYRKILAEEKIVSCFSRISNSWLKTLKFLYMDFPKSIKDKIETLHYIITDEFHKKSLFRKDFEIDYKYIETFYTYRTKIYILYNNEKILIKIVDTLKNNKILPKVRFMKN